MFIMWRNAIFFFIIPLTFCLRITEVYVPSVMDVRGQAQLRCEFELGTQRLNSLKWYKDEQEFFRYSPYPLRETITTFDVPGIHVVKSLSTSTSVVLSPLSYSSSGTYLCEVSTEAPLFSIDRRSSNMTVLGIPQTAPRIEGLERSYTVGEYVSVNCTTALSNPPPLVHWWINDKQASEYLVERYKPRTDLPESLNPYGLESRVVGLRFELESQHFQPHQMNLSCVSSVQGLVTRASASVYSVEFNNLQFSQQNFVFGFQSSGTKNLPACLVVIVLLTTRACL